MVVSADSAECAETGAPDLEITDAMLDAGMRELWGSGLIEIPMESDGNLVRRIFLAMWRHRKLQSSPR
jgi:hypothetical protein